MIKKVIWTTVIQWAEIEGVWVLWIKTEPFKKIRFVVLGSEHRSKRFRDSF